MNTLQLRRHIIHKQRRLLYTRHMHKRMWNTRIPTHSSLDPGLNEALSVKLPLIPYRIGGSRADERVTHTAQIPVKRSSESLTPTVEGGLFLVGLGEPMVLEVGDALPVEAGS